MSKLDGFSYEKNDCVVKAISIGFDVPYAEAHHVAKVDMKRKDCDGVYTTIWIKWMNDITVNIIDSIVNGVCKTITVKKFCEQNKTGTYICRRRGHAFVIKDGVSIGQKNQNSRITHVWRTN